jgi:hypothetical protein
VTTDHETRGPLVSGVVARGQADYYLLDHFVAEKLDRLNEIFAAMRGLLWSYAATVTD